MLITAAQLQIADGKIVEPLGGGARRSLQGNEGCVFYGPFIQFAAGLYRVQVQGPSASGDPDDLYWDVHSNSRLLAAHAIRDRAHTVIRVLDTDRLEFRFHSQGAPFDLGGLLVEPLLLDRQVASTGELEKLAEQLLGENAEPSSIHHALDRLAWAGGIVAAERLRDRFMQGQGRLAAKIRTVFFRLNSVGRDRCDDPEVDATREQITRALGALPRKIFDLYHLGPSDRSALLQAGYQPDFLNATKSHRDYREGRLPWQRAPSEQHPVSESEPRSIQSKRHLELDFSFQTAIARGEPMQAYCPISGELLGARHGFCLYHLGLAYTFYRFEGVEVFYLLVGGATSTKRAVYLPRINAIVAIQDPDLRWYSDGEIVDRFNVNLVHFHQDVSNYLSNPTHLAAVLGNNNMGHFFWNDLAGLQKLDDAGLLGAVTEVVELNRQFVDVRKVFPELDDLPSVYLDDDAAAFRHCVQRGLLPVRFTDARISDALAERVGHTVSREVDHAAVADVDEDRPLIWINLRAHSKVWVDQAEGYANILNALCDEYGSVAALLDGWIDCRDIAEDIRGRVREEVRLYDGLSLSIFESLAWARRVDSYICTIGSGLVLLTWLSGRPGVAHAERAHLQQMEWWGDVRPTVAPPLTPTLEEITDVGGGLYCDYQIDWRVLLRLLREALAASQAAGGVSTRPTPALRSTGRPASAG